jgi:hypothetical protein
MGSSAAVAGRLRHFSLVVRPKLWSEVTREEVFGPRERFRIEARLRALAELGFDVEEVELIATEGGYRLRFSPQVVEPGRHSRRLLRLTGIEAQENQARRLLYDIAGFRAQLGNGEPLQEPVVAARWLADVYEPTLAAIPAELRGRLEPAEMFHQILERRWFLSESRGRDVGLQTAVASYVENVLRATPTERNLLAAPGRFDNDWPSEHVLTTVRGDTV